jgi:thiosulfate/3-mercaptopyruvate sulfurtransferase
MRSLFSLPIPILALSAALLYAQGDAPPRDQTMLPADLADRLKVTAGNQPLLLHVGFPVLYRSKHIPGSVYAGPGAKAEGLEVLKQAVAKVPKDREIVVYCGCCPWDKCPNIKPVLSLLREMGYTKVKAVLIPQNFATDWVDHGYPVEKGPAGGN